MAKDTPTGTTDPFEEAEQPQLPVRRSVAESILSMGATPGGSLATAIAQHHLQRQAQANMYLKNASQAYGLHTALQNPKFRAEHLNPETGKLYTDDEIKQLDLQSQYAHDQYAKLVGVNKDAKGAVDKARGIVDFLRGRHKQMAAPPTPNYPTAVSDAGVSSQGSLVTPNYPTTVSDSGGNVGGGVNVDERRGGTLAPPPARPLTPSDALRASYTLPFATHGAKVQQGITDRTQLENAEMARRELIADKLNLPKGSRVRDQFVAVGTFPQVFRLQKTPYVDPQTGELKEGSYDPTEGTIEDQEGHIVPNAKPATASMAIPKKFAYKDPQTGEHAVVMQIGQQFYDTDWNPVELPAGVRLFDASLVPKTTKSVNEKENPVTGERELFHSSKTVGPAGIATAPSSVAGGAPQSGGIPVAPSTGGQSSTPKKSPAINNLSGKTGAAAKAQADQDARREEAYLKRNNLKNLSGSTRTMIEAAPGVLNFVDRIEPMIDGLEKDLGPVKGRWNEFWTGKIGSSDPKYMALRTDLGLLSTRLMRMHVGARGSEKIMEHFQSMLDQGKQSPENLRASLQEIRSYAQDLEKEGKDAGIDVTQPFPSRLAPPPEPSGTTAAPPPTTGALPGFKQWQQSQNK